MADADSTGDSRGRLSPALAHDAAGGDASMLAVGALYTHTHTCAFVCVRLRTCVCVCVCVCEGEFESVSVCIHVCVYLYFITAPSRLVTAVMSNKHTVARTHPPPPPQPQMPR